jgi:hypothetical protein
MRTEVAAPSKGVAKPTSGSTEPKIAPATSVSKPITGPPGPKTARAIGRAKPSGRPPAPTSAGAKERAQPMPRPLRPQDVVGHSCFDTHRSVADDTPAGDSHPTAETQTRRAVPDLLSLRIFAEVFEDLQKQRIATTNRAERGGVDPMFLAAALERLKEAENEAGKVMRASYRNSVPASIREWQTDVPGIGEHLLARLLGIIGHPVMTTVYEWQGEGADRELVDLGPMRRTVSQLWSYCGHGDPLRKRTKGMSAAEAASLGNPRAKMLVHLLAESCMKQRTSPFRVVYDEARMDYEARDWTDLHRHNAALRKVGKAILKDLWIAAGGATPESDTHTRTAPSGSQSVGTPPKIRSAPSRRSAVSP